MVVDGWTRDSEVKCSWIKVDGEIQTVVTSVGYKNSEKEVRWLGECRTKARGVS